MAATKMKFSLGSKPKPAPVKISLNKPKVLQLSNSMILSHELYLSCIML